MCRLFSSKNQVLWLIGESIDLSFGLVHVFAHFFFLQRSVGLVALRSHSIFSEGCVFALALSIVPVILDLRLLQGWFYPRQVQLAAQLLPGLNPFLWVLR